MLGTNNPSEEELEAVQGRIIEIATSIADAATMLEANSYFDECGFDIEANGAQLSAKIKEWLKESEGVEDLDPSIEDHPQPRRMARYLLENVESDLLEKPIPSELLKLKAAVSVTAIKSAGGADGDGPLLFGYPRNLVLALALVLVLMLGAIGYIVMSSSGGAGASEHHLHHVGGGGGDAPGGRRGGRGRNRSAAE